VKLSSELELRAIKLVELKRGVQSSRLTVVVLSPAFTTDRLAELAELLASHASGATGRLVPLLYTDCELPLRLDFRVSLDFRDPARWAEIPVMPMDLVPTLAGGDKMLHLGAHLHVTESTTLIDDEPFGARPSPESRVVGAIGEPGV
jgi:hypothetical protein